MKSKLTVIIICLIMLANCGFKVVTNDVNFKIEEIKTIGDNRVNYILKQKLLIKSFDQSKKPIFLTINTKKNKSIKEKNISNQITKYELKIDINVEYKEMDGDVLEKFLLSKSGSFDVASKHSETLSNEKNLLNLIVNDLVEDILYNLNNKLNDS
tara:strand:+ start:237 stop:701 length:465 start_codon:yes stop_codon:yes gene_type:complete